MSALAISLIVFVCVFGGAMLGMFLRGYLPEHHQSADSQRIVNLGAGIIGTMAALVLGPVGCFSERNLRRPKQRTHYHGGQDRYA